ncbi:MAG: hypothetical protein AAFR02_01650 [Pseudomonadota bacterium]
MALLKLVEEPERTGVLIEGQDDLEFVEDGQNRSLGSLKHKSPGENLTDLATDFWKSVRIWLERFDASGRSTSHLRFYLFTTATVADNSFLRDFLQDASTPIETTKASFESAMTKSAAQLVGEIQVAYQELTEEERLDFIGRVSIFFHFRKISH